MTFLPRLREWRPYRHAARREPTLLAERRGAIALEFALIAPVLIAVLLGMAQVALAVSTLYRMHDVVSDAGRRFAIGELDAAAAEQLIGQRLNGAPSPTEVSAPSDGDGASSGRQYQVTRSETAASTLFSVKLPFKAINLVGVFGFLKDKELSISLDVPRSSQ